MLEGTFVPRYEGHMRASVRYCVATCTARKDTQLAVRIQVSEYTEYLQPSASSAEHIITP